MLLVKNRFLLRCKNHIYVIKLIWQPDMLKSDSKKQELTKKYVIYFKIRCKI